MFTKFPAMLLIVCLLAACGSTDEGVEVQPETLSEETSSAPAESMHLKTNRRLQLERSVDQWYIHFQKQEYATADGVAKAVEQFVNANYDEVMADLTTASPRFRKVAAAALGFSGRAESTDPLVAALRDPFEDVVLAALLSLSRLSLGGVEVPTSPVTPYLSHPDGDIRSNAALVLARATKPGDGALFLPLTTAMEDKVDSVRVHTAAALGALGDPDAIPFLIRGMKDLKPLVRIRCAYAMGRIKNDRAVRAMIDYLEDPDTDVAKAVHKALMAISERDIPRKKKAWMRFYELNLAEGDEGTIKE